MDPTATTDLLEETWRSIIAVGQELSEEDWERATDCPGWSVKDHVSHVIGTERMLQGLPPADVELEDLPHVKNAIGEFNEREAEVRREQSRMRMDRKSSIVPGPVGVIRSCAK